MGSSTCLELALEGERLCKSCDFEGGINFFEAAINIGTNDKKTLSAIYSQIGNAHFYLSNYETALHYHSLDLQLAKSMKDIIGEAKASGNLGNTLKMLGSFEEAAIYCDQHLKISRSLGDKVGEGRALYNLGNVYHTKGKHLASSSLQDPGDFPDDVKNCFRKAVDYYERNLHLMIELEDKSAQGRALGNLGNTHYLLGNFDQAIYYHTERLRIAQEFGDKAAERRAHCNLGNAHIFLWDFEKAIYNFKQTLVIARELRDKVLEAQAYYSLGNTFTLLRDFKTAIDYHIKHLELAQELSDRVGEGRAYWSLGNAFTAIGNHKEALRFAYKYLEISKKNGDKFGEETATKSISELKLLLSENKSSSSSSVPKVKPDNKPPKKLENKRFSMENMNLLKLTPTKNNNSSNNSNDDVFIPSVSTANSVASGSRSTIHPMNNVHNEEEDYFLDLLVRYQGKRMNDQRCSLDPLENKENYKPKATQAKKKVVPLTNNNNTNVQSSSRQPSRQMASNDRSTSLSGENSRPTNQANSQQQQQQNTHRNSKSSHPGSVGNSQSSSSAYSTSESTNIVQGSNGNHDDLFDLIENIQSRRFEEQRAPFLKRSLTTNGSDYLSGTSNGSSNIRQQNNEPNHGTRSNSARHFQRQVSQGSAGTSIPNDDDFFEQLMRCQSNRLEDQRSVLPTSIGSSSRQSSGVSTNTRYSLRSGDRSHNGSIQSRNSHQPSIGSFRPTQSSNMITNNNNNNSRSTLPDEDFFSLIMRFQSARIEDQRSVFPTNNGNNTNHDNNNGRSVSRSYSSSSLSSRKSSVSENGDRQKCTKV